MQIVTRSDATRVLYPMFRLFPANGFRSYIITPTMFMKRGTIVTTTIVDSNGARLVSDTVDVSTCPIGSIANQNKTASVRQPKQRFFHRF